MTAECYFRCFFKVISSIVTFINFLFRIHGNFHFCTYCILKRSFHSIKNLLLCICIVSGNRSDLCTLLIADLCNQLLKEVGILFLRIIIQLDFSNNRSASVTADYGHFCLNSIGTFLIRSSLIGSFRNFIGKYTPYRDNLTAVSILIESSSLDLYFSGFSVVCTDRCIVIGWCLIILGRIRAICRVMNRGIFFRFHRQRYTVSSLCYQITPACTNFRCLNKFFLALARKRILDCFLDRIGGNCCSGNLVDTIDLIDSLSYHFFKNLDCHWPEGTVCSRLCSIILDGNNLSVCICRHKNLCLIRSGYIFAVFRLNCCLAGLCRCHRLLLRCSHGSSQVPLVSGCCDLKHIFLAILKDLFVIWLCSEVDLTRHRVNDLYSSASACRIILFSDFHICDCGQICTEVFIGNSLCLRDFPALFRQSKCCRNCLCLQNKAAGYRCILAGLVCHSQGIASCCQASFPGQFSALDVIRSIHLLTERILYLILCMKVIRELCSAHGDSCITSVNRTILNRQTGSNLNRNIDTLCKWNLHDSLARVVGHTGQLLAHHRLIMLKCQRASMGLGCKSGRPCKLGSQPDVLQMTQTVVFSLLGMKNNAVNRVFTEIRHSAEAQLIIAVIACCRKVRRNTVHLLLCSFSLAEAQISICIDRHFLVVGRHFTQHIVGIIRTLKQGILSVVIGRHFLATVRYCDRQGIAVRDLLKLAQVCSLLDLNREGHTADVASVTVCMVRTCHKVSCPRLCLRRRSYCIHTLCIVLNLCCIELLIRDVHQQVLVLIRNLTAL